ncbi:ATP synthase subunit b' [bacterium HR19]|nr:ATP synthase subunit b' [bacterium HR19]
MLQPDITFIYSFVIFIFAYLIISRILVKPLSEKFFEYSEEIKQNEEEASQLLEKAKALEEEAEKILEEERERAVKFFREKISEANRKAEEIRKEAEEFFHKKLDDELNKLEEEKKKVMSKIPEIAEKLSDEIKLKVLGG